MLAPSALAVCQCNTSQAPHCSLSVAKADCPFADSLNIAQKLSSALLVVRFNLLAIQQ